MSPVVSDATTICVSTIPNTLFYQLIYLRTHFILSDHVLSMVAMFTFLAGAFLLSTTPRTVITTGKLAALRRLPYVRRFWGALLCSAAVYYVHESLWFVVAVFFHPVYNITGANEVVIPLMLVWVLHKLKRLRWDIIKIGLIPITLFYLAWAAFGFPISFVANDPAIASIMTPQFMNPATQEWEIGSWWTIAIGFLAAMAWCRRRLRA